MARIKDLVLSAKIVPTVFYKLFDKNYSRILPAMVRQSGDTQIRSKNFDIASKATRALHNGLLAVIPFSNDKQIQSKFCGTIARWLQLQYIRDIHPEEDIPYFNNFQFNSKATWQERISVPLSVNKLRSNSFELVIPSFQPVEFISAPADTISVEFKIAIAGCVLESGVSTGNYITSFVVTYSDIEIPAQTIALPFTQAPGHLIVIAASLTYNLFKYGKVEKCVEPSYMPCAIIKAVYC